MKSISAAMSMLFLSLSLTIPALAQIGTVVRGTTTGSGWFAGSSLKPITGKPYSAQEIVEHVQTLADGTHIVETTQNTLYFRDSEGRTRTERHMNFPGAPPGSGPTFIDITDPVAGFRYVLNESTHTAQRMPWPLTVPAGSKNVRINTPAADNTTSAATAKVQPPAADSSHPHPQSNREPLGTQTMEGVPAEGWRTTTTFPAGSIGNDRPFTTTSETWICRDLNLTILSKNSDPRNGEFTTRMTNISQSEPDPALFQIPADYSVEDDRKP